MAQFSLTSGTFVKYEGAQPVRYQISATRYQLPDISYQTSATRYQLPDIRYQLPDISYQISDISFLPAEHFQRLSEYTTFHDTRSF